ncbi:hypothetical protein D1007_20432 [Hordeum vulgare]|nr:hypothetical protein D1007_20432 [Hordeum vulgare]
MRLLFRCPVRGYSPEVREEGRGLPEPLDLHGRALGELAPGDPLKYAGPDSQVEPQEAHRPEGRTCPGTNRLPSRGPLDRAMIIKEFMEHRIAPLQVHSRPLWEFTTGGDPICLHVSGLTHDELDGVMGALLGLCLEDLPQPMPPLYVRDDMEEMDAEMPSFDE